MKQNIKQWAEEALRFVTSLKNETAAKPELIQGIKELLDKNKVLITYTITERFPDESALDLGIAISQLEVSGYMSRFYALLRHNGEVKPGNLTDFTEEELKEGKELYMAWRITPPKLSPE